MPVTLTDTAIAKAVQSAAGEGRLELADASCPGLRIRISGKGSRVWVLACRDRVGRMRRFTLGAHPEMGLSAARSAARALHVEVKLRGADPIAERRQERARAAAGGSGINSLAALLDIYGEKVGRRKKSWNEARRRIETVFARLLSRPLTDLTRSEMQIVADGYAAVMSASAAVRYLRPILKWGFQRGYVAEGLANLQPPATVQRRKRVLSNAELAQVLPVIRSSDRPAWRMMHFIVLTLARREEAAQARWRDIEWAQSLWRIPDTKNGAEHSVPLSSQALALLEVIRPDRAEPGSLIFSTKAGTPLGHWDRETKKLHEVTGTSDWHRHDLRRTAATILGNLGELPDIIEAALNHMNIRSSLAATYNRSRYTPQVRQALQRLGDYLDCLEHGSSGKVLPISARRA